MNGHLVVILRRMEELAAAITARDWDAVETEHDRVRRAVEKAQREWPA